MKNKLQNKTQNETTKPTAVSEHLRTLIMMLKVRRFDLGLTQTRLASKANIDRSIIARLESGRLISHKDLTKVLTALELDKYYRADYHLAHAILAYERKKLPLEHLDDNVARSITLLAYRECDEQSKQKLFALLEEVAVAARGSRCNP